MKARGAIKISKEKLSVLNEKLVENAKITYEFPGGEGDIESGKEINKTILIKAKSNDLLNIGSDIIKYDCHIEILNEFQPVDSSLWEEFLAYSKEKFLKYLSIYGGTLVSVYGTLAAFTNIHSAASLDPIAHLEIWGFSTTAALFDWFYSFITFRSTRKTANKTMKEFIEKNGQTGKMSGDSSIDGTSPQTWPITNGKYS